MLYELSGGELEKSRRLFAGLEYNLIISAVIEGTSPGRVYVDDAAEPQSAFLCSVEGYYLGGRPDNDGFNTALGELITNGILAGKTVRPDEDQLDLRFAPDTWESQLATILRGKAPLQQRRRHYLCRAVQYDWQHRIPEGFSLRRIDSELLSRPGIVDPDTALNCYAINKINANWGSIEAFLQRGIGFAMLHGPEVVCWCIGDCASGKACEVGIRTHPDYRQRGLATLTVAATVDDCLSYRFSQVGWHCWEGNAGSIGVAEKVGFELEREYVAYVRMFDEAHHQAEAGLAAFMEGRYQEAAELYEVAFATGNISFPYQYYLMAARAWGAVGDEDKAFRYLHAAIDRGRPSLKEINNSYEFTALHGGAGWQAVMTRLSLTEPGGGV